MDGLSVPKTGRLCKLNHILIASPPRFRLSCGVPTLRAFLKFWLPVLLWMTLIFSFSSDTDSSRHSSTLFEPFLRWLFPHLSQPRVEQLHYVFRKVCHLAEYAVLALLVWRALHQSKNKLPAWSWPKVLGTLLVVFLYAALDEFHQSFVPTRTPLVSDVFIDTAGAAIGLLALWLFAHFQKRFRQPAK
jgi:VanZ family protein